MVLTRSARKAKLPEKEVEVEEPEDDYDEEADEDYDEEVAEEEEEDEEDEDEEVDDEEDDPEALIQLQSEAEVTSLGAQVAFLRKSFFIVSAISFAFLAFVIPSIGDELTKNVAAFGHLLMGLLLMGLVLFEILTTQDFSLYIFAEQTKENRSAELISSVAIVLLTLFIFMANYITPSAEEKTKEYYVHLTQEYMQVIIYALSTIAFAVVLGRIVLNNKIPTYTTPATTVEGEDEEGDEDEDEEDDEEGEEVDEEDEDEDEDEDEEDEEDEEE